MFYGLWNYLLLVVVVVVVANGSAGSAVNTTTNNCASKNNCASTNNCASRLENLELEYETLKTGYSQLSAIVRKLENESKRQGRRDIEQPVAFTAYIDANVAHMGINQAIPYNQVASNIGNAFNINTHVFTAPVTGIYLFTFVISEYSQSEMVAKLVIDGQNIVAAITNPVALSHDQQGVNSAVLQVNKGQSVWVVNDFRNDVSIRSDESSRFASFSGVLIKEIF